MSLGSQLPFPLSLLRSNKPEHLIDTTGSYCTLCIYILVFVPRIVFCSRTLWQENRLLMPVGRTETFWGCGTISVTNKPPRSVISRTALWKLYIHLRKKNNNFLKILNQHHSGLNNDLHWRCSLWKCHNLSPFRKSRCAAVFICTELNSTSLAMWQQSRIWTWTLAPFSLSPEPKHLGNAPPSGS